MTSPATGPPPRAGAAGQAPAGQAPAGRHVLGIDLGGTSTRVLVAGVDGRPAALGHAAGANPMSRGLDTAMASLSRALAAALSTMRVDSIEHAVLGVAGVSVYGQTFGAAVADVWRAAGLTCPATVRPHAEIVYAAGSHARHGFVLVSGTGAIAAEVRDGVVTRAADGHGWLLGDEGSAFWLGREAVRACLAAGEESGRPTALRAAVAAAFGLATDGRELTSTAVTGAVYQRAPVSLAELAPLVTAQATAGDPVALAIAHRAAAHLLASLSTVYRRAGRPTDLPVVIGGGVLLAPGPLGRRVRDGIDRLGLRVCVASDTAAGAAALAITAATNRSLSQRMHTESTGPDQTPTP